MPVYDYDCLRCGNSFEVMKGWNDDLAAQCAKCGANARKRFATPTIIYKGSGFYTTDYKNGSSSNGAKPPAKKPETSSNSGSADKAKPKKADAPAAKKA